MATQIAPALPGTRGPRRTDPPRRRSGHGLRTAARATPLVPAMVLIVVFLVGPIISSFYGSFTNSALTGAAASSQQFVGLKNYVDLFQDKDFPKSVLLTLVFLIGSAVIGQNVLGLGLALLMREANRVIRALVGTFVVAAWVLPEIVASFAAYAFFNDKGTLNTFLSMIGITGANWLYTYPMIAIILANIWRGTAFSMLVYSAAVQEVPDEITESAEVDGATGWQRLAYITLPVIRRSISTNLMLTTLQTLSVFTLIYVMTGGGPGTNSSTLPILAYQEAFKFSQLGFGTAIATILLIVGAVFSIVYIRALKPEVD
ncbi:MULTISPECIES: carbohydrate ABC transporter permease [unclassified Curtobacterium]|uniref:carbohydrate ABC transporter permease n=1 Tax=unclassified Curtobacterium TaxID=257496 RepID=UPI000DA83A1A|nr:MULTISPECIES: sugar ABC transporter permease [unclassified Curtobacterium]PZE28023.1 sugar ABC transporter permease [Curtobacterium sp. MCBD17_028]PZE78216.1 sugar ABC transporter permease [Curtobacterium sp. MCBD17_019]PZF63762.1 sugar ABC transporter permease [Curtobacterium sp. MCBD17_013]WIB63993.1 sugar ABC transporter permease [Curtobacterium sp. MCBD17_040]WIE55039.1 sugar ABC transporter permease [Curtobacterium sp. MCBD17_003]